MSVQSDPPSEQQDPQVPEPGALLVDISRRDRVGEFRGTAGPYWLLRPPGGGIEWEVEPGAVRAAGPEDRLRGGVPYGAGHDVFLQVAPDSYWCEALAEGLVYGSDEPERHVLGTFRTVSSILALRWLGGQALWIVDRLGLDPGLGHLADLRAWYEDRRSQRAAHALLKSGSPLLVVVPDADCTYTLSVRSAERASASPSDHHPGEGFRSASEETGRIGKTGKAGKGCGPPTSGAPSGTCGG
ncbi:hypothetical protein ACFCV8_34155 [Streptomyces sp. NPDC056347]|uniref:hypothetical protein n=1 Tax=Streptomyces sp. NPDC056347 TaxID=3345790 RepID=UPI0035DE05AE